MRRPPLPSTSHPTHAYRTHTRKTRPSRMQTLTLRDAALSRVEAPGWVPRAQWTLSLRHLKTRGKKEARLSERHRRRPQPLLPLILTAWPSYRHQGRWLSPSTCAPCRPWPPGLTPDLQPYQSAAAAVIWTPRSPGSTVPTVT